MRRGLVVVALALVATLLYAETRAEVRGAHESARRIQDDACF